MGKRRNELGDPAPPTTDTRQDSAEATVAERHKGGRRAILFGLAIIAAVVVYAYGFEVTDVNLDEIRSETRQAQLLRVIRGLARPELLTYERVDTDTDAPLYMPCPDGGFQPPAPDVNARHITVEPPCVSPGASITITGRNFSANARGTLTLVPPAGGLELRLDEFQTDENGSFVITVDTRERPEDDQQTIRAITRENIGSIFNRTEVWQDDNENGVQDPVDIPDSGTFTVEVDIPIVDELGAALLAQGAT